MKYSGRNTSREHQGNDWKQHNGPFNPSITTETVFNAQWTDCPIEVEQAVKQLWRDYEFGNDHYYFQWDHEEIFGDGTPDPEHDGKTKEELDEFFGIQEYHYIIDEYLLSKGVKKCLIHWWW